MTRTEREEAGIPMRNRRKRGEDGTLPKMPVELGPDGLPVKRPRKKKRKAADGGGGGAGGAGGGGSGGGRRAAGAGRKKRKVGEGEGGGGGGGRGGRGDKHALSGRASGSAQRPFGAAHGFAPLPPAAAGGLRLGLGLAETKELEQLLESDPLRVAAITRVKQVHFQPWPWP
jgi:hypothetical protein